MSAQPSNPNLTPLDVALANQAAKRHGLPPGNYRYVDRVDRREPSDHAIEVTGDRMLKDASKPVPCRGCSRPTLGAYGPAPQRNYWPSICQSCKDEADHALERSLTRTAKIVNNLAAYSPGLNGDAETRADERGKVSPAKVNNATDIGDGLGLPLVSIGPGPIGSATQTEIPADAGPFAQETDHDRHNDDAAQRAAQARADAEGGESNE